MDDKRREPRFAAMTLVEVMWEDDTQTPRVAAATIEDRARSGVCIRIGTPINVGSRLTMKSHREQFSGVVTNSRSDKKGYMLGIKLDTSANGDPKSPAKT